MDLQTLTEEFVLADEKFKQRINMQKYSSFLGIDTMFGWDEKPPLSLNGIKNNSQQAKQILVTSMSVSPEALADSNFDIESELCEAIYEAYSSAINEGIMKTTPPYHIDSILATTSKRIHENKMNPKKLKQIIKNIPDNQNIKVVAGSIVIATLTKLYKNTPLKINDYPVFFQAWVPDNTIIIGDFENGYKMVMSDNVYMAATKTDKKTTYFIQRIISGKVTNSDLFTVYTFDTL